MKIAWEERHAVGKGNRNRDCLVALLVSAPAADGSSEQNVIAQLGSIEKRFMQINIKCAREFQQGLFWKQIESAMDRLALTPEMKDTIVAAVSERVPIPGENWALWGVTCIPRYDPD
jgi:hypothetical protein